MLTLEHVTKYYGRTLANDDISFRVEAGQIAILLGPNGAGKSTLIKCISGLLRYTGTITIGGFWNKTDEAKRLLAYFPETPAVYDLLTVAEHLEFIRRAYRLAGLVNAANGWPVKLFPVGGWLGWSFAGVLGLDRWWPGLALCAVWLAVMVVLLVRFPGDWYEDVLRTAELAQSAIAAKKEGNLDAAPGKIRLGKTGLGKGWGASAFYYKQKREDTRGGWLLLSPASLAFAGVVIVLAVLWRSAGLLTLFGLSVYLQIFSTGQNRLSRELGKPFLYLVPEPAFAKLLQCLRALLPSAGMEAVVTFVPVCLLLGLGPGSILACVFSRLTYALLFQSGDLLVERFWSGANKTLLMVLYLVILLLLTLPGVIVGTLLFGYFRLPGGAVGGLIAAGIVNLPVALLLLYSLRNMLEDTEYTR